MIAATPAFADRHCSYARQSAFYTREISDDAVKSPDDKCPAKMAEARERLDSTMIELEICSCDPAEAPMKNWLKTHAGAPPSSAAACTAAARSINAIAREVLIQVEKCF